VTDVEDLNRLIKEFTEQSTQLSEKVKTRKLNAIAVRTRLKESQRTGDLKKVEILKTPHFFYFFRILFWIKSKKPSSFLSD